MARLCVYEVARLKENRLTHDPTAGTEPASIAPSSAAPPMGGRSRRAALTMALCVLTPSLLLDSRAQAEAPDPAIDAFCQQTKARGQRPNGTQAVFDGWLEHSYDRYMRPNVAIRSPTEQLQGVNVTAEDVRAGLYINQIWGFDEIDGTFMIQAYLTLGWRDPRLCFDDSALPKRRKTDRKSHGKSVELDLNNRVLVNSGVDRLHELWLPDINIQNSLKLTGNVDPDADLFKVFADGEVEWSRRFVVTLSVDYIFTNMPFDDQYLYVNLESYRMPAEDLQLRWDLESFPHGLDEHFNNPEWVFYTQDDDKEKFEKLCGANGDAGDTTKSLSDHWSHCSKRCRSLCTANTRQYDGDTDKFARVRFQMVMKRQTHSWIVSVIVPSIVLCVISYLGLFIARDNPGRPGVHCVTVLAHFTLDSSMRAQIPHVGYNMWIDRFQTGMLFSHLVLFLEYTLVHYSARQKYREQVIADAQLRKLMAFDAVAAEILKDQRLATACGLAAQSSTPPHSRPVSPGGLGGRLTTAAGSDEGGDEAWSAGAVDGAVLPTSLSAQELEQALASMPPQAKRTVLHKLRATRAELGGSVSEWGETTSDFHSVAEIGRRTILRSGSTLSLNTSAERPDDRGMFGLGGRETIGSAAVEALRADLQHADAGDKEPDDGLPDMNVTPGRQLPGTPDGHKGRRMRLRDRSTTERAVVLESLSEPLFGSGSSDKSSADPGVPPYMAGQGSPVEELDMGHHDDDRTVREREWCGRRMKIKCLYGAERLFASYNDTMTLILANASNLDRPCRLVFPILFSIFLSWIALQAGTDVSELLDNPMDEDTVN